MDSPGVDYLQVASHG